MYREWESGDWAYDLEVGIDLKTWALGPYFRVIWKRWHRMLEIQFLCFGVTIYGVNSRVMVDEIGDME